MLHVAVIGAGAAGTAAAWTLARAGAEVVIFNARSGATALYSGALDAGAWERADPRESIDPELVVFGAALSAWSVGAGPCRVATASGLVRTTRGMDSALLNLELVAGGRVGVADVAREDWDGVLLAKACGSSSWAKKTKTEFQPLPLRILHSTVERRIPAHDFAQLFDDPARSAELAAALNSAARGYQGLLLGPWLGTLPEVCERVRQDVELAIGETTSAPGGAAGARFEHARDRLLAELGIERQSAEVLRLEPRFSGWTVYYRAPALAAAAGPAETREMDAVVLCIGGLAGGGVRLATALGDERRSRPLGLSLDVPVQFQLDGKIYDGSSSLYGPDFSSAGVLALERLGIAAQGVRALGQPGLFLAGDVIADRPRTALEAAGSGIAAGRAILKQAERISQLPRARADYPAR
ncbi:MAG TPA: FAD-dependent oxidoreductase [Polyangiaceae bacterium]|nr:FAD-dependent oxidoreductase [Polyangiaceae bacterium]